MLLKFRYCEPGCQKGNICCQCVCNWPWLCESCISWVSRPKETTAQTSHEGDDDDAQKPLIMSEGSSKLTGERIKSLKGEIVANNRMSNTK